MAYSKAKLKSIGDRASPCFKPFLIGNLSDTFLPTRTLLYVSVRLFMMRDIQQWKYIFVCCLPVSVNSCTRNSYYTSCFSLFSIFSQFPLIYLMTCLIHAISWYRISRKISNIEWFHFPSYSNQPQFTGSQWLIRIRHLSNQ